VISSNRSVGCLSWFTDLFHKAHAPSGGLPERTCPVHQDTAPGGGPTECFGFLEAFTQRRKPSTELAKLTQTVVDQQKAIVDQQKAIVDQQQAIEVLTKKVLVLEGDCACK